MDCGLRIVRGASLAVWYAAVLAGCAPGGTLVPTRLVTPPPLVVITPTIIYGGGATAAAPPTAAPPTVAPPERAQPPSGAAAPTLPPVTATPTPPPPPPTATIDPRAPRATKLTADGCCPQPQWLPDGRVAYYGTVGGRRGTWAVPRAGGPPALVTEQYGAFSADGQLVAYPDGTTTRVARLDGAVLASWQTAGRVYLAPQGGRAAWFTPAGDVKAASPSLDPPVRVAIGQIAGGAVAVLPPAFSAERLQWFPDGRRILIAGREGNGNNPGLWVLDTASGAATQLVAARGLEQPLIAPDGRTIAYTATLQDDRAANGTWLIDADGGNRRRLPFAGGYRWSPDSSSLLYIPLAPDRPTDELWRYRLADNGRTPIVAGGQPAFLVAADEWEVAPAGDAIAYRSAADGAIWVIGWAR